MLRLLVLLAILMAGPLWAAATDPVRGDTLSARLIAAEMGVAPEASRLSAGLHLMMEPGWKTYWRSPGEVGLPPEIDWSASENVSGVEVRWPAPTRFTAFEIENFGYGGEVVLPLDVALERPGEPARLALDVDLLVCSDICVPERVSLALDLPAGGGVDRLEADLIAPWAERVPDEPADTDARAHMGEALTVSLTGGPFAEPDVFPEAGSAGFGPPTIRTDGDRLWASLPVTGPPRGDEPLRVTVTGGPRPITVEPAMAAGPIAPPGGGGPGLLGIALAALLGGLILNVMPCVLPVLGVKLAGAVGAAGQSPGRVRAGFLASAAGIVAFMWALALAVLAARAAGLAVGWGVQFQQPVFLALMVAVTTLFAANLAGAFEVTLPQRLGGLGGGSGLAGDFATGAFAAVLATPCSAPFLGTAVAFALAGGPLEVGVVFTLLGVGLALPYLAVAARPPLVARLPRPGRWMLWVRAGLAVMLGATALWLAWVLSGVAGPAAALGVLTMAGAAAALLALGGRIGRAALPGAALVLALALATPGLAPRAEAGEAATDWARFDEGAVAAEVLAGRTVFVDVTADWCLTCQANHRLVLDRGAVAEALAAQHVTPMRADWTRPDEAIRLYLEANGRFGIPFYAAYGPGAPGGVVLPEVLTPAVVLDALATAGGVSVAFD